MYGFSWRNMRVRIGIFKKEKKKSEHDVAHWKQLCWVKYFRWVNTETPTNKQKTNEREREREGERERGTGSKFHLHAPVNLSVSLSLSLCLRLCLCLSVSPPSLSLTHTHTHTHTLSLSHFYYSAPCVQSEQTPEDNQYGSTNTTPATELNCLQCIHRSDTVTRTEDHTVGYLRAHFTAQDVSIHEWNKSILATKKTTTTTTLLHWRCPLLYRSTQKATKWNVPPLMMPFAVLIYTKMETKWNVVG